MRYYVSFSVNTLFRGAIVLLTFHYIKIHVLFVSTLLPKRMFFNMFKSKLGLPKKN